MDRLCSVYVLLYLAFWAWMVGTSTQYIKVYQEMEGCSLLVTYPSLRVEIPESEVEIV